MSDETKPGVRPEVEFMIQSIIEVTRSAQEARKFLMLEQLDNIVPHLLELEKQSRNARAAIAAIEKKYNIT